MSTKLFDLTGKNALVTGGTHGIGMAIATGLAEAGARIIINDVFPEKLDAAKEEYAKNGINIHTYVLDVTDEDAVEVIYIDHNHLHVVGNVDAGADSNY